MIQSQIFKACESEQFTFYRVPKLLFTNERYSKMSAEAKLLYGLILDRMGLSVKNDWSDENGAVFIYFTLAQVGEVLSCGRDKAGKLLAELERTNLIFRKKQGQGKPDKIYVLKFVLEHEKSGFLTSDFQTSRNQKNRNQDNGKSGSNNTDINNTDFNDNHLSINYGEMDRLIKDKIEYDILLSKNPAEKERINEIVSLLTDTLCSTKRAVRISGNDFPADIVRSRLLKLTCEHIEYVLDTLNKNVTKIKNIRGYLLSALYNAPTTMDSYYKALVNHDMQGSG